MTDRAMRTRSNSNEVYLGRGAGREIHENIKGAKKSVKIVSPYLSADYIKDLIWLHKKGVDVTLVTCDGIEESAFSDFRKKDLVREKRVEDEGKKALKKGLNRAAIGGFAASALAMGGALAMPVLIFAAGGIFVVGAASLITSLILSSWRRDYEPIFRIKVFDSRSGKNPKSTELVHSKIFVVDEWVAFLGSVNFTYSGFRTHYESAIKVEDISAVKEISREVERLFNSKDLRTKEVEEWM